MDRNRNRLGLVLLFVQVMLSWRLSGLCRLLFSFLQVRVFIVQVDQVGIVVAMVSTVGSL